MITVYTYYYLFVLGGHQTVVIAPCLCGHQFKKAKTNDTPGTTLPKNWMSKIYSAIFPGIPLSLSTLSLSPFVLSLRFCSLFPFFPSPSPPLSRT